MDSYRQIIPNSSAESGKNCPTWCPYSQQPTHPHTSESYSEVQIWHVQSHYSLGPSVDLWIGVQNRPSTKQYKHIQQPSLQILVVQDVHNSKSIAPDNVNTTKKAFTSFSIIIPLSDTFFAFWTTRPRKVSLTSPSIPNKRNPHHPTGTRYQSEAMALQVINNISCFSTVQLCKANNLVIRILSMCGWVVSKIHLPTIILTPFVEHPSTVTLFSETSLS